MRRRAKHQLWALILLLVLCGSAGVAAFPQVVRADYAGDPTDPSPAPIPQAGDPDYPDGTARFPKPGPGRGTQQQVGPRVTAPSTPGVFGIWMRNFRMAFAAVYRFFFRF